MKTALIISNVLFIILLCILFYMFLNLQSINEGLRDENINLYYKDLSKKVHVQNEIEHGKALLECGDKKNGLKILNKVIKDFPSSSEVFFLKDNYLDSLYKAGYIQR